MFEVDLGPILGRFWPDLSSKMAPKPPPKTTQKRAKKQLKKRTKKRAKKERNWTKKPDPAVNGKRRLMTFFVIWNVWYVFSISCFVSFFQKRLFSENRLNLKKNQRILLLSAALALLLGRFWPLSEPSWLLSGRSWVAFGRSWAALEPLLSALGPL